SDTDLHQYATTPPVTHMKVVTNLLPWAIHVNANDPKSFIRVVDVLETIYRSLRTGISPNEWNRAQNPFRNQVKKAYHRRCQVSRPFTLDGYEEKQGVRRVDYLHDKTMFLGLRP
ncbi:hypothetical protein K439DRAFT_1238724, partial [Ramaria rubella]